MARMEAMRMAFVSKSSEPGQADDNTHDDFADLDAIHVAERVKDKSKDAQT